LILIEIRSNLNCTGLGTEALKERILGAQLECVQVNLTHLTKIIDILILRVDNNYNLIISFELGPVVLHTGLKIYSSFGVIKGRHFDVM
jgi:hypothetical protein